MFTAPGDAAGHPIAIPGLWRHAVQATDHAVAKNWPSGVFARTFELAEATQAVLACESIRWGGEVRCDGRLMGTHDLGFAPVAVDLGALEAGTHRLEITARGWTSLARFDTGDPKIPCSAANWFYEASGGLPGRVRLRPYREARIAGIQVTPHAGASCALAISLASAGAWTGSLRGVVTSEDGATTFAALPPRALSLTAGEARTLDLGTLVLPGAPRWSPDHPQLLRVSLWLEDARGIASARTAEFGLRTVTLRGGHLFIDDRRTPLFGSSAMFSVRDPALVADRAKSTAYASDWLKRMNANVCQPHMDPIYGAWLEACDRSGMMVFCEMPNFPDVQRLPMWSLLSPYERTEFWSNLKREITALIGERINHPSIIAWTPTNEGNGFGDWEREHLFPFVKSLDPARPVLFSGDLTPDFADQHSFSGNWYGTAGDFERGAEALAEAFRGVRPVANSEFAQYQGGPVWYASRRPSKEEVLSDAARIALEQAEALRRSRFDLMMPFNYPVGRAHESGRIEDVEPAWHALRNAYARISVSVDWRWRHARAGAELELPVWVVNDSDADLAAVVVDVVVVAGDPGFAWDGTGAPQLAHVRVAPGCARWSAVRIMVRLRLPQNPGVYTIAAIMPAVDGIAPVVSHRPLRLYAPSVPARSRAVGVIEQDGRIAAWLRSRGHRLVLPYGDEKPDTVVVGEGMMTDARMRVHGFGLARRIESGTRLVVLEQRAWNLQILAGLIVPGIASSSMQVAIEPLHPLPELTARIGGWEDFRRLNGEDGIGLRVRLEPPAVGAVPTATAIGTGQPDHVVAPGAAATAAPPVESAWTPLILGYSRGLQEPDWALAYRTFGSGEAYACQIPIASRLDASDPAAHDPVAERLFATLVEGPTLKV